jgi:hypothetical protein
LTDQHDVFQALINWVEFGNLPEQIIATKYVNDIPASGVAFTRPLCVFPKFAKYKGAGNSAMQQTGFAGKKSITKQLKLWTLCSITTPMRIATIGHQPLAISFHSEQAQGGLPAGVLRDFIGEHLFFGLAKSDGHIAHTGDPRSLVRGNQTPRVFYYRDSAVNWPTPAYSAWKTFFGPERNLA